MGIKYYCDEYEVTSYRQPKLKHKLSIVGKSKELTNSETRHLVKWVGKYLFKEKLFDKIKLRIIFGNEFSHYGWCDWVDHHTRPREFEIYVNIDRQGKHGQMKTLIHELTHVHQWAIGNLKYDFDKERELWKNKQYKYDSTLSKYKKYRYTPWEEEARINEQFLFRHYTDFGYSQKV